MGGGGGGGTLFIALEAPCIVSVSTLIGITTGAAASSIALSTPFLTRVTALIPDFTKLIADPTFCQFDPLIRVLTLSTVLTVSVAVSLTVSATVPTALTAPLTVSVAAFAVTSTAFSDNTPIDSPYVPTLNRTYENKDKVIIVLFSVI